MSETRPLELPESPLPAEAEEAILHRIHRIQGQLQGLVRMIEGKRDCRDILRLIAAIRSAAQSLGTLVLAHYLWECLHGRPDLSPEEVRSTVQRLSAELLR